jgi:hypothetical protein
MNSIITINAESRQIIITIYHHFSNINFINIKPILFILILVLAFSVKQTNKLNKEGTQLKPKYAKRWTSSIVCSLIRKKIRKKSLLYIFIHLIRINILSTTTTPNEKKKHIHCYHFYFLTFLHDSVGIKG